MADDYLDIDAIDEAVGDWLASVEFAGVTFAPGEMPDVEDEELMEKGSRSEAGRKAARARWGNRGPDSEGAKAKRSEAARRAAATRRAKREAGESKGPESDEQAAARMGKEFEAKRSTGEPIEAIREIAARNDYVRFIETHADALGLKDTSDALKRTGVDEPEALVRACERIRASGLRRDAEWDTTTKADRASHEDATNTFLTSGDVMTATPVGVAVSIIKGERCKSQFETNSSRGMLSPDVRAGQESAMFLVHPGLAPSARPTYGYVSAGKPTAYGPAQYGEIRFQLRDSVKDRTTITMGDSLGSPAAPIPMGSPVGARRASDSRGHSSRTYGGADAFQDRSYAEAQIMGGWDRSDVVKVYVPSLDRFGPVDGAAAAAGIPVEYY